MKKHDNINKKQVVRLIAALLLTALICSFSTACSGGGVALSPMEMAEVITFKDPRFEAILRSRTGMLGDITKGDALEITELDFNDCGLSDISDIAYFRNLKVLKLGENRISDISALSGLTNLERLYLESNQVSDISALSGLKKLTKIHLAWNRISDISALFELQDLKTLYLHYNYGLNRSQARELREKLPDSTIEY